MGFSAELPRRGPDFREIHPETKPDAKVAVFYANDDFGKDYLAGLRNLRRQSSSIIVAEESYEGHRALDRFPYRQAEGHRRRRLVTSLRRIWRAGDQEDGRTGMEADARHDRRLDLDRRGHEAAGFEASEGVLSATISRTRPIRNGRTMQA